MPQKSGHRNVEPHHCLELGPEDALREAHIRFCYNPTVAAVAAAIRRSSSAGSCSLRAIHPGSQLRASSSTTGTPMAALSRCAAALFPEHPLPATWIRRPSLSSADSVPSPCCCTPIAVDSSRRLGRYAFIVIAFSVPVTIPATAIHMECSPHPLRSNSATPTAPKRYTAPRTRRRRQARIGDGASLSHASRRVGRGSARAEDVTSDSWARAPYGILGR